MKKHIISIMEAHRENMRGVDYPAIFYSTLFLAAVTALIVTIALSTISPVFGILALVGVVALGCAYIALHIYIKMED